MKKYRVFIGHAFDRLETDDLRDAIQRAFDGTVFEPWYADMEVRATHILAKIEEEIESQYFGIYDISTGNENVCLELGFARGTAKDYYIIYKKGSNIPADLRGLGAIEYAGYKDLTEQIRKKVVQTQIEKVRREEFLSRITGWLSVTDDEVLENVVECYQAEEMIHRFGEEIEDEEAINGKAWLADLSSNSHHFIYGPYLPLEEKGEYIAIFKMKIGDNSYRERLLILDVFGASSAAKRVCGTDFGIPEKYGFFAIPFRYGGEGVLEYRALNIRNNNSAVLTDYIAIVRFPGPLVALDNDAVA